jgi:hypothetical protein
MRTPGWLLPFEWLDVYFLRSLGKFFKAEYTGFLLIPAAMIILVLWEQYGNAAEDMGRICAEIESMKESAAFPADHMMQLSDCMGQGQSEQACRQKIPESPEAQNLHREARRIQKICTDYPIY